MVISSLEVPRLEGFGLEVHPYAEFGSDRDSQEITDEIVLRAVAALGVEDTVVPAGFPVLLADKLRAAGIDLTPDRALFDNRRRVKTDAELREIRRAQAAAEAGMAAARGLLRRARRNGGNALEVDGEPLTCERIKVAIAQAFLLHGATADDFIVSHGSQAAIGHHMGAGAIQAGETIIIDLWPRDNESSCSTDMTRTFVVGEIPAEVVEWQRLCKEALDRALAETRPGVTGRELYEGTCEIFEAAGYPTQRTKKDGEVLSGGFMYALGHGVGLDVHEQPLLGLSGHEELLAGEVIAIEPSLDRSGFGGCRLDDLLLVTTDGAEKLTSFPYELAP